MNFLVEFEGVFIAFSYKQKNNNKAPTDKRRSRRQICINPGFEELSNKR
jgi:hypothetical protein